MPAPGDQYRSRRNDSGDESSSSRREWTDRETAFIRQQLNRQLGPEYISHRQAGGGMRVPYLEGWKVINLANEVFGFNGWNSEIKQYEVDFCDEVNGRISLGMSVKIRVTLRDGTYREDVGYGQVENARSKAMAYDKCKKEATTDALKRALRLFGNALGNCLYDSGYTKNVSKVKAVMPPFDANNLLRRPEIVAMELAKNNTSTNVVPSQSQRAVQEPVVPVVSNAVQAKKESNALPSTVSNKGPQNGGPSVRREIILESDDDYLDNYDFSVDGLPSISDRGGLPQRDESELPEEAPGPSVTNPAIKSTASSATAKTISTTETSSEMVSDGNSISAGNQARGTPDNSSGSIAPSFFSARAALELQKGEDASVSGLAPFDPSFESPSIRRTVPNVSAPIKRIAVESPRPVVGAPRSYSGKSSGMRDLDSNAINIPGKGADSDHDNKRARVD